MTLDQIRIFIAIAEKQSLAAAATALHKTQPTLSVSLKNLEEDLGVQLFSRDKYRMTLNKAGEKLLVKAKALLHQARELENLGKYFGGGKEAEIKLVVDPLIPIQSVLKTLKPFDERHCSTQLTLISQYLSGGVELLLAEKVELAIVIWPNMDQKLEYFPLLELSMKMVISPKFPLFGKKITEQELKNQPQVIIKDSAATPTDDQFGVLEGGRHWDVTDAQTKKEILLAGMGWGSLPLHMIEKELNNGELVPLDFAGLPQQQAQTAFFARNKNTTLGPVASELWEQFSELAPLG